MNDFLVNNTGFGKNLEAIQVSEEAHIAQFFRQAVRHNRHLFIGKFIQQFYL